MKKRFLGEIDPAWINDFGRAGRQFLCRCVEFFAQIFKRGCHQSEAQIFFSLSLRSAACRTTCVRQIGK